MIDRRMPPPLRTLSLALIALSGSNEPALARPRQEAIEVRVARLLNHFPVFDGHNDLPWEIRQRAEGDVERIDLSRDHGGPDQRRTPDEAPLLMTDIPRLRAGHVGAQFWSVWIPPTLAGPSSTRMVLEQIDLVKVLTRRHPETFQLARTSRDVATANRTGRIASLIGMEGGTPIDGSLALLRQFYDLGVRYMTLTHQLTTDWADSATDAPRHDGLSLFGRGVVSEMNRIGMIVDLSHVSPATMADALATSRAPVILSHSGARAVADHPRNVPDGILRALRRNRGIVMVNFAPEYATDARVAWEADRAAEKTRLGYVVDTGLFVGQPERAAAALALWDAGHPAPPVTISSIADHIDHIAKVAGPDSVALGSDFDGVSSTPLGLDGVDKFPALFVELMRRGWSDRALAKLARGNAIRVLQEVEAVAASMPPSAQAVPK